MPLQLENWGLLGFEEASLRQDEAASQDRDILAIVQHPPTVTCGLSGNVKDLIVSKDELRKLGVQWSPVRRGGELTYHGPGQFIAYPIVSLRRHGLRPRDYVKRLCRAGAMALSDMGVPVHTGPDGAPGLYLGPVKVGSVGVGLRRGFTRHGLAINLNVPRDMMGLIRWCGLSSDEVGSLLDLGYSISPEDLSVALHKHLSESLNAVESPEQNRSSSFPAWIHRSLSTRGHRTQEVRNVVEKNNLPTICAEARCPNAADCFSRGHVSFLVLGKTCTRGCPFCAVATGKPQKPDGTEPRRLGLAVKELGLRRAVITMVDRDDLDDGGESHMVACVEEVRKQSPTTKIEVLTGDFRGCSEAPKKLVVSGPDCYSHNMETVPRLYPSVRPGAVYSRSIALLERVHSLDSTLDTKSALMVGLGETRQEVLGVMKDLLDAGCKRLVIGQYLAPLSDASLSRPGVAYMGLDFFKRIRETGLEMGFDHVEASPWARSSSHD